MAEKVRAVFFDFDGTLADSYEPIAASVNHVRQAYGMEPLAQEEVRRYVGRGLVHLLEHTVPGCDVDRAAGLYRAHHPSVMFSGTTLLPGAREAAERLHAAGFFLAICSNKPRGFTEKLIEHIGLGRFFQAVLGPEDVPKPKPDPAMLRVGLSRLEVAPGEALYVGDMVVDIETGRGAGVRVWVVPTGSDSRAALQAARPDRILESLLDLPGALEI